MKVFAGIDGGGTKTRLALAGEDGSVLSYTEGGCCDYVELGIPAASAELARLWQLAWQQLDEPARPADALFLGMGSILAGSEARTNCEMAEALGLARPGGARADNDAQSALAGGLLGEPGILLISGTGSACLGRNARGERWRAGGWGYRLDDVGSAYAVGLAAMIAVTRAADGRGQQTALSNIVAQELGLREIQDMYRRVHEQKLERAEIAGFAPAVMAVAFTGDAVARQILEQQADGLVEMVVTVGRHLQLERPQLALTGGLITSAEDFRNLFLQRLARPLPGFRLVRDGLPPVLGSILLAAELGSGTRPSLKFVENLRRTCTTFTGLT